MSRYRMERPKPPILRNDVYQSNPLINARKEFDALGMRIFLLGLRGINPHFSQNDRFFNDKFPMLFIPTAKLTELLGGNTVYLHELKERCEKIFDTIVELNKEDGGFVLMHLFQKLEYKPNEGLYLQFDELMRPYLLDLFESKGYTKLDVEQIFQLTSTYATRLVELLLQYQNISQFKICRKIKREMTIDELRFALNVPKGAYEDRVDNFRKKILDDPIAEVNSKTLYEMSYRTIKQGVKVVGVELELDASVVPIEDKRYAAATEPAIGKLLEIGFSLDTAQEIFSRCAGTADCLKRIAHAQQVLEKQKARGRTPVENETGFLHSAILKGWKVETPRKVVPPPKPKAAKSKPKTPRELIAENQAKKAEGLASKASIPKKAISPSEVEMIFGWLDSRSTKPYVDRLLKSFGWTLKEFLEKHPR
ncbi:MAG: replication initiation protein [Selenomonadaceae bacterium]|nr:replication initiation protein [Selenomonadaceae bacterium]